MRWYFRLSHPYLIHKPNRESLIIVEEEAFLKDKEEPIINEDGIIGSLVLTWNRVALLKSLWNVCMKVDNLWVK